MYSARHCGRQVEEKEVVMNSEDNVVAFVDSTYSDEAERIAEKIQETGVKSTEPGQ